MPVTVPDSPDSRAARHPKELAAAATALSRTFVTYSTGPVPQASARYARHVAQQEAHGKGVVETAPGSFSRPAAWSRRFISPDNPMFSNMRYPADPSLLKAPTSEYRGRFRGAAAKSRLSDVRAKVCSGR